jgi:hypothetical protein
MVFTMKHYPWKFKINAGGIEWYKIEYEDGAYIYAYYFMWTLMNKKRRAAWREKPYGYRVFGVPLFGLHKFWHDTIHAQLNLYWFVLSWSTQWTTVPKDFWE